MSDWEVLNWGDLATLEYGKGLRGYQDAEGEIPVYGTNGAVGWTDKPLCRTPGVIIGRKGAYRGVHFSESPFFVIDTAFYLKPKRNLNIRWAYYQLLTQDINGMDSGSAIPSTSRDEFYHLPVLTPPRAEQDRIAGILKTLDDKIALNRKLNETLEGMARALFQSWFVDFDPVKAKLAGVRHERDPERACMAALSGKLRIAPGKPKPDTLDDQLPTAEELDTAIGEIESLSPSQQENLAQNAAHFSAAFQESELGLVPEGWEVKSVSDFGKVICGKTPSKKNNDFYGDEVPFLKIPDMHGQVFAALTNDRLSRDGANSQKKKEIPPYSVCVSCIATVGKVAITCEPTHTNQQINSVVPNCKDALYYLYFTFLEMNKELHDLASGGSATLNLNTGNFSKIGVLEPTVKVLESFHYLVCDQFESILISQHQSRILAELRDTLLPKLLSGELTVGEASNTVEAAVES